MSETALSKLIRDALTRRGVWCERINSGGYRGRARGAKKGTPDILVLKPYGWIEVKRPGEDLLQSQVEWHAKAERLGVRHGIAETIEEAQLLVSLWIVADEARGTPPRPKHLRSVK